ncbi:MAG TPA: SRPBCC family protein [Candidatus Eisenbacteria bacterium]|nr:SRPBCC family protein [Candidatus Eisenbacteria bacterium]
MRGRALAANNCHVTGVLRFAQPEFPARLGKLVALLYIHFAMSQRLQVEHWIPVPLPPVFSFFADPHNLPRIMPPSQGAKILKLNLVPPRLPAGVPLRGLERMAGAGTEITFKFRAIPYLPVHERWTALITEFVFHEYFSDTQKQGPFKSWHHTHTFESRIVDGVEGTLVGDEVEYEVGFGMVGTFLERAVFQRVMRAIFEHRKQALERVFAAEIEEARLART